MLSCIFKNRSQKSPKMSSKFRPLVQFLEDRTVLSGNPVAGVTYLTEIDFHGHYDGSAAHLPNAQDFQVVIKWGDGSSSQASDIVAEGSDNFAALASHTYAQPGNQKSKFEVDITNLQDPGYNWVQESYGIYVDQPLNPLLAAANEGLSDLAKQAEALADSTGIAQAAEAVQLVNGVRSIIQGGISIAQNVPSILQNAKNVAQGLFGANNAASAVGGTLQTIENEATALAKVGTPNPGTVLDVLQGIVKINSIVNNNPPVQVGTTPNGTPQFPYVLGIPSSAIQPGTVVLGKWDTWPSALTGAVEAKGGITASSISIPGTLEGVYQQWGPNAKIPQYVRNLYASGSPFSNGAGQGIYLMEMAVANGQPVIFDVSNVNLAQVQANASNALAFAKNIDPRASIMQPNGQPAYPAIYAKYQAELQQVQAINQSRSQPLALTEQELVFVENNPGTFQGKIQFYQNQQLVTWNQVFGN